MKDERRTEVAGFLLFPDEPGEADCTITKGWGSDRSGKRRRSIASVGGENGWNNGCLLLGGTTQERSAEARVEI